jgi:hypothetical protein
MPDQPGQPGSFRLFVLGPLKNICLWFMLVHFNLLK